ncbi:MAG TPA: AMIN domain-containing protein, partial [Casimicrobiaceae bacterium]
MPLSAGIAHGAALQVASARLWPAQEYTRLILESAAPIEYQLVLLKQPNRVVLDLARVDATPELGKLGSRVQGSDPYIASIRVGTPSGGFLRVVLDVKSEVNPQVFALKPVAEFGHRLVVDLYPPVPLDPLMALLESESRRGAAGSAPAPLPLPAEAKAATQSAESKAATQPAESKAATQPVEAKAAPPPAEAKAPTAPVADAKAPPVAPPAAAPAPPASAARKPAQVATARRITIAIDPGHGGEDPGAVGPR